MKKIAVEKAELRLERARTSLQRAVNSRDFGEFESAWSDFLTYLNTVSVVLKKGAKDNPQSRQWFGDEQRIMRQDPLLRYLHQARNSDEHGIEPIAVLDPGGVGFGHRQGLHIHNLVAHPGGFHGTMSTLSGEPVNVRVTPSHARLITVLDDRYGDSFDPPKEHLRQRLPDESPHTVGQHGLAYFERLVVEARSRVA